MTGESTGSLYLGLMSGTSMDGIDAAVVSFGDSHCRLHATLNSPYPEDLRNRLQSAVRQPTSFDIDLLGGLDHEVAVCFADAALGVLAEAGLDASEIDAIGSHGQTVRHRPDADRPFTLQIGDPSIIATRTGITTVADWPALQNSCRIRLMPN